VLAMLVKLAEAKAWAAYDVTTARQTSDRAPTVCPKGLTQTSAKKHQPLFGCKTDGIYP
jgi:hypothetical protein